MNAKDYTGRPCEIHRRKYDRDKKEYLIEKTENCLFVCTGQDIEYPERDPMLITFGYVEDETGQVMKVCLEEIKFTDKKPEPLADDSGNQTTHNQ